MKDTTLVIAFVLFQGIVFTNGRTLTELDINIAMEEAADRSMDGEPQPRLVEGDIVLTPELQQIRANKGIGEGRDALAKKRWPNAVVPYTFDKLSRTMQNIIKQAIARFNKYTCIKFIPRTTEQYYVTFFHGKGCYSWLGYQEQVGQKISLHPNCGVIGIAQHEMMHALGFYHEQSRLDRDNYVTINFDNIEPKYKFAFEKYKTGEALTHEEPYDKKSVMHYGNYYWAINKNIRTITVVGNPNELLGQRNGFSQIDINQLNKHYSCSTTSGTGTGTGTKPETAGGSCPNTHPYAYWEGKYCCKSNKEKVYSAHGWKCDGSAISKTSTCCLGDDYSKCTKPPCSNSLNPSVTVCRDQYQFCKNLKNKEKWCKNSRQSWVALNCKKSCNRCTTTPVKPIIVKPCEDQNKDCSKWANGGYCTSTDAAYKAFMLRDCRKSCGICSSNISSSCVDIQSKKCPIWKKSGFCQNASYSIHMKNNCKKSCGHC